MFLKPKRVRKDGKKELIAVLDGYLESEQSWLDLLNDVEGRGLALPPSAYHTRPLPRRDGASAQCVVDWRQNSPEP